MGAGAALWVTVPLAVAGAEGAGGAEAVARSTGVPEAQREGEAVWLREAVGEVVAPTVAAEAAEALAGTLGVRLGEGEAVASTLGVGPTLTVPEECAEGDTVVGGEGVKEALGEGLPEEPALTVKLAEREPGEAVALPLADALSEEVMVGAAPGEGEPVADSVTEGLLETVALQEAALELEGAEEAVADTVPVAVLHEETVAVPESVLVAQALEAGVLDSEGVAVVEGVAETEDREGVEWAEAEGADDRVPETQADSVPVVVAVRELQPV